MTQILTTLRAFFLLTWVGIGPICTFAELGPTSAAQKSIGFSAALFPEMDRGLASAFAPRWTAGRASATWQCTVREPGLYRLTRDVLVAGGMPADELVGARLQMFDRDREIAVYVSTDGLFGSEDYLLFYGQGYDGSHSRDNVYGIRLGDHGLRWSERNGSPIDSVPDQTSYRETVAYRPDTHYVAGYRSYDASFDHWFAAVFKNFEDITIGFEVDALASEGDARLLFRAGDRDAVANYNPARTLDIRRNGQLLASPTYSGNGSAFSAATFDVAELSNGVNTFAFRNRGSGLVIGYLQDLYLEYPRQLELIEGQVLFDVEAGLRNVVIEGVGEEAVFVLDVSDSDRPVRVSAPPANAGRLRYGDVLDAPAGMLVCEAPAIRSVVEITSPAVSGLADRRNEASYLIITHPAMAVQAQRLADYREAGGLTAEVVMIDEIFDTFGFGLRDPAAIRQFIGYAYHHWQGASARYVCLIGDASYDPLNNLGNNLIEHVPTHLGAASFNWAARDMWFGCVVGEDILTDVSLGRIATDNPTVLRQVIDKIIAFEAAPADAAWRSRGAWIADGADAAGDFRARSESLRQTWFVPAGMSSVTAYRDERSAAQVRSTLLAQMNAGVRFLNYIGHGLQARLGANENLFSYADAVGLNNPVRPIVPIFACQSGQFQGANFDPTVESLGEGLVEQVHGAVACIAATTEALEIISAEIAHGFYEAALDHRTARLGDALRAGFQRLHVFNYSSPELLFYNLFGDPALVINPITNVSADSDGDGMLDGWERDHGLQPFIHDANEDLDRDGLSNVEELSLLSHPGIADSDGDGLLDGWELPIGTTLNVPDSDGDGQPDGWEWRVGLNPLLSDTGLDADGDRMTNGLEYVVGTHPMLRDTDFDGVEDGAEWFDQSTDPLVHNRAVLSSAPVPSSSADQDGDRIPDVVEVAWGFSPTEAAGARDADGDGLTDVFEYLTGTDPLEADSDGDGLSDRAERHVHGTDPLHFDSDRDGLWDGTELTPPLSNPLRADSDEDGVVDAVEQLIGMNPLLADSDGDGMSDIYEWLAGLDPLRDDTGEDLDGDRLSNGDEYNRGTLAEEADTDGDGLEDGDEVLIYGTHPSLRDTDNDGANDNFEIEFHGTDPLLRDSDEDGAWDGWEITFGLNPLVKDAEADNDGDNVTNLEEFTYYLNPMAGDTDGDGLSDRYEIDHGLVGRLADRDRDGLNDGDEVAYGTLPNFWDTDGDGLSDGDEVHLHGSNPLLIDSDDDGLDDFDETMIGTNPAEKDAASDLDGDGLSNQQEFALGTSLLLRDTDGDGLEDRVEVVTHLSNPLLPDSDGDGLSDHEEWANYGTLINNVDSDEDGMPDGWEVSHGLDPLLKDHWLDSDGDGLASGLEFRWGTDPAKKDSDGDNLDDLVELTLGLNPASLDSDGDGLSDTWEWQYGVLGSADAAGDKDGDGLLNIDEFRLGSNPYLVDSDGDGSNDYAEMVAGTDPTQPASQLVLRTVIDPQGNLCLQWPSTDGRTYRVLARNGLDANAAEELVAAGIAATPPQNMLQVALVPMRMYRIEVE